MDNKGFDDQDKVPAAKTKKQLEAEMAHNNNGGIDAALAKQNKQEERLIMKNIIVISFAFMMLFTAFQSMASLQSSINKDANLGTYSLSVIYAALIVSSMFVPSYLLKKFGAKWGMVFAMFCYSLYIGAQFYPRLYTLVPAAFILGFGAAPLWIAKCAYLTKAGYKFAELTGATPESVIVRFFGIFFLFFQASLVWGNLISSWALGIGREVETNGTVLSEAFLLTCGVNYCPEVTSLSEAVHGDDGADDDADGNSTLADAVTEGNFKTTPTQIYTLAGVYLACSIVSPIVISVLVDPLTRFTGETKKGKDEDGEEAPTGLSLVAATLRHMKKNYQQLLIPLTIWSGLEQGFFGADFTAAYITCGWGVHNVGYVMITYGVFDAVFSMGFGAIIKVFGRIPIFVFGACLNIIVIGVLFNWMPNPNENYVFFILAALWGIADAVWQTQINALYGVIFPGKESSAGFSNYRLWESAGFIFAYILQTQVCVFAKLWIMVAVLLVGMSGYLTIEMLEKRKLKQSSEESA